MSEYKAEEITSVTTALATPGVKCVNGRCIQHASSKFICRVGGCAMSFDLCKTCAFAMAPKRQRKVLSGSIRGETSRTILRVMSQPECLTINVGVEKDRVRGMAEPDNAPAIFIADLSEASIVQLRDLLDEIIKEREI